MNIEEIKKEIKNIKLSKDEKSTMLERVFSAPGPSPYAPVKTNWKFSRKTLVYVLACLVLMAVSGSGISYAALNSIPGEPLYGVKVNITEPILDTFAFTPASRAERQAEKAITRLKEAEKLATNNSLTSERRMEIEKRFNQSADNFEKAAKSIDNASPQKANSLRAVFESNLKEHMNRLDRVSTLQTHINNDQDQEVNSLQNAVREKVSSDNNGSKNKEKDTSIDKGTSFSRNRSIID